MRVLERFEVVYMVVDAIGESKLREDLLEVLQIVTTDPHYKKLRLLASSRDHVDIRNTMTKVSTSISMDNPHVQADIKKYVHPTILK